MTGPAADWFVGSVALVLGGVALLSSLFNWEPVYQLRKPQWLEQRLGRSGVRLLLAVGGAALAALGAAIAAGWLSSPPG
jgi:hypothetical protein